VGHIVRMEDERILRKVFNGKFYITRPLRKLRTDWEGVIWRDISQIWGRQWPRRGCSTMDGWVNRYQVIFVLWYSLQIIMASCQNG